MRILLIEDDEILIDALRQTLTSQHYVVDTVEDGRSGWEYAQSTEYDLILMDVGLPGLDGISLCQRLRSEGCSTPILLITARDATTDRIRGLDAGADDYLIKPLDLSELQARVRALLRRGTVPTSPILQVGKLRLDPSTVQVSYGNQPLNLTPKEYSLLELFLRNPSRVFSRGQILQHLWTFDDPPLEESVKAHIKGLRQKLKAVGAADWIENVYGIGYRLREGVDHQEQEQTERSPLAPRPSALSPHPPSTEHEHQFNQAMGDLWEQYQGLMAQRLEALQKAAAAIATGKLTEALRQEAGKAAHKLAGVLGMFEKESGTLLAREMEHILLTEGALLPEQEQRLLELVQEMARLLNLGKGELSLPPEAAQLLLVDTDPELQRSLQILGQSTGMGWQFVKTLRDATDWLRSHTPSLVVLAVDTIGQENTLALVADLAARTPAVPTLVLAAADELLDRVTVARAGAQGFLVKPVTAPQVWEAATQLLQKSRSQTANVLVVDDDPIFLGVLRSLLEPWGMRMTGLDDPLRFWDMLQLISPDLLILDVEMPEVSGIELCQAVRTDPTWQGLPILFLTAHKDSQTVQQVFAAGADDFIIKPVVVPELLTRITNRLERNRLLQTLSTRDPITGLANYPQSSRDLEWLLQEATQTQQPFCLVVLTVADLRSINIQYGHGAGNQVLQRWGQVLQSALRSGEVTGYWGNGEFVAGLPGLKKAEARDRLADGLATLRRQIFSAPDGRRFQATCQVAIAEYPTDGATLQALYQAGSSVPVGK
ncbi:response regulator [Leptothermofonsia sp. ETS-13]|uniref:response regulator n=1 Tax=Leptothermofonsia sp. ETS-13 TaxID=3035696 RepID=UPI003B9F712D